MLCKVHRPLDNHSEWLSPVLQFDEIINLELHTQTHHMIMNEGGWEKKTLNKHFRITCFWIWMCQVREIYGITSIRRWKYLNY